MLKKASKMKLLYHLQRLSFTICWRQDSSVCKTAWNCTCLMSGERAKSIFPNKVPQWSQSAAETCHICITELMSFILYHLSVLLMSPIAHPCHHPSRSWLIMKSPDGKWSYLAKPVAAEAAQLLREHFPSILKNLVSKASGLPLVCLQMFGSWFFVVLRSGKGWLVFEF